MTHEIDIEALASRLVGPMKAINVALADYGLSDKEAMAAIQGAMEQISDATWDGGESGCVAVAMASKWPELANHMRGWRSYLATNHGVAS